MHIEFSFHSTFQYLCGIFSSTKRVTVFTIMYLSGPCCCRGGKGSINTLTLVPWLSYNHDQTHMTSFAKLLPYQRKMLMLFDQILMNRYDIARPVVGYAVIL